MTAETALYVRVAGDILRLEGRSAVAGRGKDCDLRFDEHGVSRRHCEIVVRDEGTFLRDLGSTHGTFVDGRRMRAEERLGPGAVIRLSAHGPRFELVSAVVQGRPVTGAPPAAGPPGVTGPAQPRTQEMKRAFVAPMRGSRFLAGLFWGLIAGIAAGLGAALAGLMS